MVLCPVIPNSPGLKWSRIQAGWQARWRARHDLVKRGWPIKSLRIWESTTTNPEPDELSMSFISDRCNSLQADMLAWAHGGPPEVPGIYDASWDGLVREYKTDPDSPYHKKRFVTRQHYDSLSRRIVKDCPDLKIIDTDARKLLRLYESWIKPDEEGDEPKIAMGHALVGMLRTLTTFGATIMKCTACKAVRSDLHDMRVTAGKAREEALSAEQATLVRNSARSKTTRSSIALAQAFQFECTLRQKDVIGEWVPIEEKGPLSDIINGTDKWIRGLRWEEIDASLVLRHITSKKQKGVEIDLNNAPMVIEELRLMAGLSAEAMLTRSHLPESGPVIVSEATGFPWQTAIFRRVWREEARACGIPDNVRNMDSRAGAITEGFQSGARPDAIQKSATHSSGSMTSRYNRGDAADIAGAMKSRVAHRNKTGTEGA